MSVSALPVQLVNPDTGNPYSSASRQETYALAVNNVVSAPVTVYGGDYVFSQQATAYGTIALQTLAPDGVTWQTLVSKTASDGVGGTGLALGSYAVVRVVLTGTTAAYANLSRIPN